MTPEEFATQEAELDAASAEREAADAEDWKRLRQDRADFHQRLLQARAWAEANENALSAADQTERLRQEQVAREYQESLERAELDGDA